MGPWVFLGSEKIFKEVVRNHLPEKRPMDDLEMEADLPYEEEYAIGNLSPYSFYHGWYFPKKLDYYFRRYVLFEGVSDEIIEKWKQVYIYLLKKMTYRYNGKMVLLKSPVNTGRIKLLLETFPDSKFIHICRDPYKVYLSTWRLYKAILPAFSFQHVEYEDVDRLILEFYKNIYKRYFKEKRLIPKGNLIEIRYEEFVKKPVETLETVYTKLGIKGFEQAKPAFKRYVKAHENYKPYTYKIDEDVKKKIYSEWGFAFKEFGYTK
ncbi:MAG TPA: sulfotransferase [Euryarchaeota archaeon]|nr:sulfotransferase [Euryarchaeota archaeon]